MKGKILFLLLCLPALTLGGMYRWVDDQGNVVYSQSPPPDGRRVREIAPPPAPAEPPEAAGKRLERTLESLEQSSRKREKRKEELAKRKKTEEERRRRCQAARRNLETLTTRPPNTLFQVGENEYRRFTPEERQRQIDELQKIIEKNCN